MSEKMDKMNITLLKRANLLDCYQVHLLLSKGERELGDKGIIRKKFQVIMERRIGGISGLHDLGR
jgi:hypothetical protein